MTDGEKMVWSVVFALELNKSMNNPPREVTMPDTGDEWEKWEIDQAISAAEVASSRVERMSEVLGPTREAMGDKDSAFLMLKEMLT